MNVDISEVRQIALSNLKVQATPTLILVDSSGRVMASWVGKLSPKREEEVFQKLAVVRQPKIPGQDELRPKDEEAEASDPDSLTAAQLVRMQERVVPLPIVDIRSREEYREGHISGSLNIPSEELEIRLEHEVPKDSLVVLYCHYCSSCDPAQNSIGVATLCTMGKAWLHKEGFTHVKVLRADFTNLQLAGIKIVEAPKGKPLASPATTDSSF
jgi:rhodanese-related sulfurtransferase